MKTTITHLSRLSILAALFTLSLGFFACSDSEDNDPLLPSVPLSDKCVISKFQFSATVHNHQIKNIEFKIDQKEKTITASYLDWINREEPDKLIATFEFEGKEVKVGDVLQESGRTTNSFKKEIIYTVYAENGNKVDYRVTIICPQINMEIPVFHFKPEAPIVDKKNYVKSKLDLFGGDITEGLWNSSMDDVEIRLRGNSTMGLKKKPYRVKFPKKFSPLGLNHAKAKSWVLLANDTDKTLLRNALAFSYARILFQPFTNRDPYASLFIPATLHVNVYINEKYIGMYTMSDQIERDEGRVNIESLKASDGDNPNKITGGYLMEVDIHANPFSEPFYFVSSQGMKITPKYPKDDDHHPAQYEYFKEHFTKAENALYGSNYKDREQGWRKYFDEQTAVDYFIVNELTGNPDAYCSIYFYKRRGYDKIFFGPVWDFDKAFNNDNRTYDPIHSLMTDVGFSAMEFNHGNHWFYRLWTDNTFRLAVKSRWNSKKAELLAKGLDILEQEPERLAKSIKANFIKWDVTEQELKDAMPAPTSYEAGLSTLKSYLKTRYDVLDKRINAN